MIATAVSRETQKRGGRQLRSDRKKCCCYAITRYPCSVVDRGSTAGSSTIRTVVRRMDDGSNRDEHRDLDIYS